MRTGARAFGLICLATAVPGRAAVYFTQNGFTLATAALGATHDTSTVNGAAPAGVATLVEPRGSLSALAGPASGMTTVTGRRLDRSDADCRRRDRLFQP